ncbi:2,3-diaminopropionate biosynthesis protein SbnB [Micromonospora qiuiae]|uniref:2,3-diaminopropionate biosynthesis protein SbnB n=1 Tax=Micromonospora qiuiae TaxID=502268 RepID=A0ABQ4JH14_9ACTN|nr:2,3-diaminopropionate biosynthesis protein SbnB [Micromonospora qiuiae]GIJ28764.1 2,3-diaminopropionate biosynthesis protein SbnB [Micromonospora qiuiae]
MPEQNERLTAPEFAVISGRDVADLLDGREKDVVEQVRAAYLVHAAGDSVNPDSYFLRFPDKPEARIIALPAYLGGEVGVAGLKWIASFPGNITSQLPRASAVLVLNDYRTGYPIAVLESAAISAARTAASAALAARTLATTTPATVGVVGAGIIARTICHYLATVGIGLGDVRCHDLDDVSASALAAHVTDRLDGGARVTDLPEALGSDLVVLATTAARPYIDTPFRPGQVVLNVSLRDLAPEVLEDSNNVLDDVEHCLKADTSPHLLEQQLGHRNFVSGVLADVLRGEAILDTDRPTIFSPFGLGVLDLAVGHMVHRLALREGRLHRIPDFFGEARRW